MGADSPSLINIITCTINSAQKRVYRAMHNKNRNKVGENPINSQIFGAQYKQYVASILSHPKSI
jgi:hypothetical protein